MKSKQAASTTGGNDSILAVAEHLQVAIAEVREMRESDHICAPLEALLKDAPLFCRRPSFSPATFDGREVINLVAAAYILGWQVKDLGIAELMPDVWHGEKFKAGPSLEARAHNRANAAAVDKIIANKLRQVKRIAGHSDTGHYKTVADIAQKAVARKYPHWQPMAQRVGYRRVKKVAEKLCATHAHGLQ